MTPEQLKAHRDELLVYLNKTYEPDIWQKVIPAGRANRPTWQDGVWLAWDARGQLVALIGASDGWWPDPSAYPLRVELELTQEQFDRLPSQVLQRRPAGGLAIAKA